MGKRPGRAAALNAAAALKNTPRVIDDGDDEEMQDVSSSNAVTPMPQEENVEEAEDIKTPAPESEPASAQTTPVPEPVVRKKKLGRPLKYRPSDSDKINGENSAQEPGTAGKGRGRGRGGFGRGGGRWARRGGPSHVTQQPVDKEGNMMDVINDEVELPEDSEGEKKVDKFGHLKDGREYRCRTFTVLGRGQRLYMLSTEPARCVGFRDSYLFFTKHKRLYKIIIDEDEKRDLIDRELIPHSYKGRAIGIVTARSVFREFGAQIIVGGRRIIDDYEVARAKVDGIQEGELADPSDVVKEGEEYNKNQYVAWHGASSVYHSGAPTVPFPTGKITDGKKKKITINDVNWMSEHAREASRFNSTLGNLRRQNLSGIYDTHTNLVMFPKIIQPTRARWLQVNDVDSDQQSCKHCTEKVGSSSSIFKPLKPICSKNLLVIDTIYESAPASFTSNLNYDDNEFDIGFSGLSSISEDIKAELPPECLRALEKTLKIESQWKSRWELKSENGSAYSPIINKGVV
ncbi:Chromatin structure-remodeling complex subunit rsc7 [Erysiphe necator]|uniref:Putative nuclear localization protein npl6 n=1 Tax=Uncinula necator TaxID=52586 RepID=A0A0B1P165_UNCNE|nr:Chromatin structure-remodeling complex subunit rsc7 [Erysiphe necator]KHJ31973.1 putative nuclear localization protein npl6 [Erysiphe necator]